MYKHYKNGYYVSDKGKIKRIRIKNGKQIPYKVHIYESEKDYYFFIIHNLNNKHIFIHRAVAEVYLETIEGKHLVDHIDGNRKNNDIKNLRWVNFQENNLNKKCHRIREPFGDP